LTPDAEVKLVPVMATDVPAAPDAGFRAVTVGRFALPVILKVRLLDVPEAVVTVMVAEPAVAIRLALTGAVSEVALASVVASAEPFQLIFELESKFVPVTVNVNVELPATAEEGERLVIVGRAGLTEKAAFAVAPAEVVTEITTAPAVLIRLDGTDAVSCVVLT
jgi:hypothetical protein